jgi:hypothetical protein
MPAFRRLRQKDLKFNVSLGYMVILSLKKTMKKKKKIILGRLRV